MHNYTTFDPAERYIFIRVAVADVDGKKKDFLSILDTGAPITEFSDEALLQLGYLDEAKADIALQPGLQTKKYGRVTLPHVEICSHPIDNLEVYVSHFDKSWGIKALIGIDFFRRFRVTVDYDEGVLITKPY